MADTATHAKSASISLQQLSKRYKSVHAVRDISLDVKSGEFLTFLGPSGSGKTTTLMMIAGFTTPDAGDILVSNESIVTKPPHKRNIGMVFQQYALFPHMTIADNIAFPLRMRRMGRSEIQDRIKWALDLVKLTGMEQRRPNQLSGGQQQRIALARALVYEPPVLLLDEPLGALDRKLREGLQIELKRIHHQLGTTIIYVTHDQDEALTMSDRIAVFNDGQIMQLGTPSELYRSPQNRFVADFVGETNLLSGQIVSQQNDQCTVQVDDKLQAIGMRQKHIDTEDNQAVFSLRPESILIGARAVDKVNKYEGVVEETLYSGETTKFRVRLSSATELTVKWFNRMGEQRLDAGSKITVGWNPEDMLMVEGLPSAED